MKDAIKMKKQRADLRARRVRSQIRGTAQRPRLSVHRSLKHIGAQLIDDEAGVTLVAATDRKMEVKGKKPVERAQIIGAEIAKLAKEAGITAVVFDRGSAMYKGRVKALAEAAREAGLEF